MSDALPDWVKPGISFHYSTDQKKYHVRAIVDEQAVLRWWGKTKQRWHYSVEPVEWFAVRDGDKFQIDKT